MTINDILTPSYYHVGWRHINKSIICFIYRHWSLAVTINMRYYLETWVALHFTLQAESRNIPMRYCLQLLITKKWRGQGGFNCTSPGEQFWLPFILCNIKYVRYERSPKRFKLLLIVMQLRIEKNLNPHPFNKLFWSTAFS